MVVSIDQRIPDIRVAQNRLFPKYSVTCDWVLLEDGTLDDSQALASAIIIALGSNALAGKDDQLPDPDSEDREGWWGDLDCQLIWDGWPLGSKLWLLRRSQITPIESLFGSLQANVLQYIDECIRPFMKAGICSTYQIADVRVDKQRIDALIQIFRGPKAVVDLRYQLLWDNIRATDALANPYPRPG